MTQPLLMNRPWTAMLLVTVALLVLGMGVSPDAITKDAVAQDTHAKAVATEKTPTRLAVLWTSDDPLLAQRMLLMYVGASQRAHWFDENLIIIWGPSAKLVAEDKEIQAKIQSMMKAGVKFQACVACASMYGVVDPLRALGVEVKGMGAPLTKILQDDGWKVMTL